MHAYRFTVSYFRDCDYIRICFAGANQKTHQIRMERSYNGTDEFTCQSKLAKLFSYLIQSERWFNIRQFIPQMLHRANQIAFYVMYVFPSHLR